MKQKGNPQVTRAKKAAAPTPASSPPVPADNIATSPDAKNSLSENEDEDEAFQSKEELESNTSLDSAADLRHFLFNFRQEMVAVNQELKQELQTMNERVLVIESSRKSSTTSSRRSSKANSEAPTSPRSFTPPRTSINTDTLIPLREEATEHMPRTPAVFRGFKPEDYYVPDSHSTDDQEQILPSEIERKMEARSEVIRRRDSIEGSALRYQQEHGANKIFIASERYLEINWKEKSVDGFLIFLEKVVEYQYSQGMEIPSILSRIDPSLREFVKEVLRRIFPHQFAKSMEQVFGAKIVHVIEAAKVLLAPSDARHFNKLLTASCKAYGVSQTGKGYATTRARLHSLRTKFLERYDFLKGGMEINGNEANVPPVDFKQGGILEVWMALTPKESAVQFKELLVHRKYKDLQEFFQHFFIIVEETYQLSKSSIRYMSRIKLDVEEEQNTGAHRQNNTSSNQFRQYSRRNQGSALMAIGEEAVILEEGEDWDEMLQYEELEGMQREDDGDFLAKVDHVHRDAKSKIIHMGPKNSNDSDHKSILCRTYLLSNNCKRNGCPYSHNWSLLQEERKKYMADWVQTEKQNVERAARVSGRRPPPPPPLTVRQHHSPPISDQRAAHLNGIEEDVDNDDEVDEFNLLGGVLSNENEDDAYNATHRKGTLELDNGVVLDTIVTVLFDTGAAKKNYISLKMVEELGLLEHLISCRARCKVANGKLVSIEHKVRLHLILRDAVAVETKARLTFLVLKELTEDLVLGIRDILKFFRAMFVRMLQSAKIPVSDEEDEKVKGSLDYIDAIKGHVPEEELLDPWSKMLPEAPEEVEINEICESTFCFLDDTPEEAFRKFLEVLPTKISEEFQAVAPVVEFLSGEASVVFNPVEWRGISMEPVELEFSDDMPKMIKPYRSKIPQAQLEAFEKELSRLVKYLYRPSTSPIASPVLCAKKATYPFVRIVNDLRRVNEWVRVPQYMIPDIITSLHKMIAFDVFIDLDVTNAFHQVPLGPISSRLLSVQTQFGHYEPKFLPEGVASASMILMQTMHDIFRNFDSWMVVIHDNLLVLANGYEDAFEKLKLVVQRCREVNLYLKIQKSSFGLRVVEFFGYVCTGKSYRLSEKRKSEVAGINFPLDMKGMQRFLGAAMFFKPFIPNFSEKTALLYECIRKDFLWSGDISAHRDAFELFKRDLLQAFTLYHPDPSLDWFLYVDASDYALGGVLIQKTVLDEQQVIAFTSKKFSGSAKNWSVFEKEAFGMFYSVHQLRTYLMGKPFIVLTDHRNLVWMETSEVPKVIRMRLFLQSFAFRVLHIAGVDNVFADWLSRKDCDLHSSSSGDVLLTVEVPDKAREALMAVHNARVGHNGIRRTWLLLNQHFPGHGIKTSDVAEFIALCATCQKYRLDMSDSITPSTRTLSVEHRHTCGYDLVYITPGDKDGYKYLHVLKLMPSRIVGLYPAKDLGAESLALALFTFFLTYGVVDVLVTDPGSNVDSGVTRLLLSWFGIRLRMSLVNRHQSNGVERTHREILKFLSMLVADERVQDIWSQPQVIGVIQFLLNVQVSSETGKSPYDYLFGTLDAKFMRLPDLSSSLQTSNEFLKTLEGNLKEVREAAYDVVSKMQEKRKVESRATYVVGDMVLINAKTMGLKRTKLSPNFLGPYMVKGSYKSDITLEHIVTKERRIVHMEHIKPFYSDSYQEAYKAALVDYNQYVIDCILSWRGDPEKRSEMQFLVRFEDGDEVWLPYAKDLYESTQFRSFCERWPPLLPLRYDLKGWKDFCKIEDKKPISILRPGNQCYVDLRAWGYEWFETCGLPMETDKVFVVHCACRTYENKKETRVLMYCKLFNQTFVWKNSDILRYGNYQFLSEDLVHVDAKMAKQFPGVLIS